MSFASEAAVVRDEGLPVPERVMSLKHCVARFKPLGYRATLHHLEVQAGIEGSRWTSDALVIAIDALKNARQQWILHERAWANERKRRKSAGQRDVTDQERAERRALPWLSWPRPNLGPESTDRVVESSVGPMPFPPAQLTEYQTVIGRLPRAAHDWHGHFEVRVGNDRLRIPQRIYNPEPDAPAYRLPSNQQTMLDCLYTRHADGHVRQAHVAHLLDQYEAWVIPYVVALVGEYVVDIIDDIRAGLGQLEQTGSEQQRAYGRFVVENPSFMSLTRQRAVSYWSEYYRHSHVRFASHTLSSNARPVYPAFEVLEMLNTAARARRSN